MCERMCLVTLSIYPKYSLSHLSKLPLATSVSLSISNTCSIVSYHRHNFGILVCFHILVSCFSVVRHNILKTLSSFNLELRLWCMLIPSQFLMSGTPQCQEYLLWLSLPLPRKTTRHVTKKKKDIYIYIYMCVCV